MNTINLSSVVNGFINRYSEFKGQLFGYDISEHFLSNWNKNAENFGSMFDSAVSKAKTFLDRSDLTPTRGISVIAANEPDKVRDIFSMLFQDDEGNLVSRQTRIEIFQYETRKLLDKYAAGQWRYIQDMYTVFCYFMLYDPSENYLYSPESARRFMNFTEYNDDFKSGSDFDLVKYYKMCDEVSDFIIGFEPFVVFNKKKLYGVASDKAGNHFIVSNLVNFSDEYNLYNPSKSNHVVRDKSAEDEKAKHMSDLLGQRDKIRKSLDAFSEQFSALNGINITGSEVTHRIFGTGKVVYQSRNSITVSFPSGDKRFVMPDVFTDKFLGISDPNTFSDLLLLKSVIHNIHSSTSALIYTENELLKYI